MQRPKCGEHPSYYHSFKRVGLIFREGIDPKMALYRCVYCGYEEYRAPRIKSRKRKWL